MLSKLEQNAKYLNLIDNKLFGNITFIKFKPLKNWNCGISRISSLIWYNDSPGDENGIIVRIEYGIIWGVLGNNVISGVSVVIRPKYGIDCGFG
jgi:hypothetical protein